MLEEVLLGVLSNSPWLASIYIVGRFILQPTFSWVSAEIEKHRAYAERQADKKIDVEIDREKMLRDAMAQIIEKLDVNNNSIGEIIVTEKGVTERFGLFEETMRHLSAERDASAKLAIANIESELRDIRNRLSLPPMADAAVGD